jgi:hypothetical protein
MSQKCPQCHLFSPPEAERCDCGYDFASKTVRSSYLLKHVFEKRGGEAKVLRLAAGAKIRTGVFLLVLSLVLTGVGLLAGSLTFWGGATMVGALMLYRGLRQRKQQTLDRATRDELIRRS